MYIIFSVCLHRHSIGVLGFFSGGGGGGKHVNTTLTSHFTGYLQSLHLSQCQWKCDVLTVLFLGGVSEALFVTLFLGIKKKILQREMCSAGCSWCQGIASVLGFISAFSGCLYIVLIGCILWFYLPPGMRLSRNVGQCVLVWCACCRAEARLVRPLPVCGWSSQQGTTRKSVLSFYVLKVLIM